MSIIARVAPRIKPARVTRTVTLYDATLPFPSSPDFGGIAAPVAETPRKKTVRRYCGQHAGTMPFTEAEMRAVAQVFGELEDERRAEEAYDAEFARIADEMAQEAEWQDSYESGIQF